MRSISSSTIYVGISQSCIVYIGTVLCDLSLQARSYTLICNIRMTRYIFRIFYFAFKLFTIFYCYILLDCGPMEVGGMSKVLHLQYKQS